MSVQAKHSDEAILEADSLDGELVSEPPRLLLELPPISPNQPAAPPTPPGYHWRATIDLEPGMVIARPVVGTTGSRVTMHLAIGSAITPDTIAQLMNKGVECVAVLDILPPNQEIYADMVNRYQARLRAIFEARPDETCRPLLEALIKNGPLSC